MYVCIYIILVCIVSYLRLSNTSNMVVVGVLHYSTP